MLILKIEKMIFIRLHVSDRVLGFILAGSERCACQSESWCHNIAHYVDPAGIFLVLFFFIERQHYQCCYEDSSKIFGSNGLPS